MIIGQYHASLNAEYKDEARGYLGTVEADLGKFVKYDDTQDAYDLISASTDSVAGVLSSVKNGCSVLAVEGDKLMVHLAIGQTPIKGQKVYVSATGVATTNAVDTIPTSLVFDEIDGVTVFSEGFNVALGEQETAHFALVTNKYI